MLLELNSLERQVFVHQVVVNPTPSSRHQINFQLLVQLREHSLIAPCLDLLNTYLQKDLSKGTGNRLK